MARSKSSGGVKVTRNKPQTDTTRTQFNSFNDMIVDNWDRGKGNAQRLQTGTEKRYQEGQVKVPIVPKS